jgi:anti-sigma-K factor RskA
MDVQEYIASGILELYVLGSLSESEMSEVEGMCSQHTIIATELRSIQEAFAGYTHAFSENPNPLVHGKLMEKISADVRKSAKIISIKRSYVRDYHLLIAVCITALVISTAFSIFFYKKWSEVQDTYLTLVGEKNLVAQNFIAIKYQYDSLNNYMDEMNDINMDIITLRATDSTQNYKARVYWNKRSRETYLDVKELPEPEQGKQYQLWAIFDGKPVDAGMINIAREPGMQRLKIVMYAQSWVVTKETLGGSLIPTMDQMYLISKP